MDEAMKIKLAIIIVIALGAIGAVQQYLLVISNLPTIAFFLTSAFGVAIFGLLRTIEGFLENLLTGNTNTQFEAKQLAATLGRFTVYIYPLTAAIQSFAIGTPYEQTAVYIAGAIAIVVDVIIVKLGNLSTVVKTMAIKSLKE
jgi:hypothetical protein